MTTERIALVVPAELDIAAAGTEAARLRALVSAAAAEAEFALDLTTFTLAPLPLQLAEACRKSLTAAGRSFLLGAHLRGHLADGKGASA